MSAHPGIRYQAPVDDDLVYFQDWHFDVDGIHYALPTNTARWIVELVDDHPEPCSQWCARVDEYRDMECKDGGLPTWPCSDAYTWRKDDPIYQGAREVTP